MKRYFYSPQDKPRKRGRPSKWIILFCVIATAFVAITIAHLNRNGETSYSKLEPRPPKQITETAKLGGETEVLDSVDDRERPRALVSLKRTFAPCAVGSRDTCVVDGDTIWLDGVKIRIADIDTPEIRQPKCSGEKVLGERAKQRLIVLLNEAEFELASIGDRDEDVFGRKLRVILRKGDSLGDQMVSEGLARTWTGRREPWC